MRQGLSRGGAGAYFRCGKLIPYWQRKRSSFRCEAINVLIINVKIIQLLYIEIILQIASQSHILYWVQLY